MIDEVSNIQDHTRRFLQYVISSLTNVNSVIDKAKAPEAIAYCSFSTYLQLSVCTDTISLTVLLNLS